MFVTAEERSRAAAEQNKRKKERGDYSLSFLSRCFSFLSLLSFAHSREWTLDVVD
jgi:hypothetical protein